MRNESSDSRTHSHGRGWRFWGIFALLVVAAFVLRLYAISDLPSGLFYDEAYEGLDALSLFGRPLWEWPLFFTAINGREPLFVYLVHLAQRIDGPTIWSVRVISATAGALLTPALVWLAWELAPHIAIRNRHAFALWSGAASLALLWPQTIARLGQRISLFALLEVLALAALWRAWNQSGENEQQATEESASRRRFVSVKGESLKSGWGKWGRSKWWILAGAFAGLSFYTYLAVRLLPLVVVAVAVALVMSQPQGVWRQRWGLLAWIVAALVVAAPLLLHFARFPEHFNMRTGQVNILAQGGWPALWANVETVLGMAFVRGDFNLRLNYPNRPVLDPFTLLPFLLGLIVVLRHFWRPGYLFLLSGLGVMLLPTLLSEEAPNFGRSFGAFPFVVLFIALGIARLIRWGSGWRAHLRLPLTVGGALALVAATLITTRVYFVDWANHPDLFAAWDTGYTALASQIKADSAVASSVVDSSETGARIYAGPGAVENPTVEYLLADLPSSDGVQRFDGRTCLRVATAQPARYYVLTTLDQRGAPLLGSYLPESSTQPAVTDGQGAEWARLVRQPPQAPVIFPEMNPLPIELSDGVDLLGYWTWPADGLRPGETFYVRLFWRVNQTPSADYTAFVQLLAPNDDGGWQRLAGADRPPGDGSCPTDEWLPGEVVVDELQFTVPADISSGDAYDLAVGFYNPETSARMAISGVAEDWILIGPVAQP